MELSFHILSLSPFLLQWLLYTIGIRIFKKEKRHVVFIVCAVLNVAIGIIGIIALNSIFRQDLVSAFNDICNGGIVYYNQDHTQSSELIVNQLKNICIVLWIVAVCLSALIYNTNYKENNNS